MLVARISLTLSRHSSLSFIALGRSSGQHPVSSHSCWMYVRAGRPAFAWPCVGIHKSTSLMSSSLLLQQCPACLVRLTWIVFVIGGRWPYSWCLVGCCCQDLFRIARSMQQTEILPRSTRVSTIVWLRTLSSYKAVGENAWWELLKDYTSFLEQIMEGVPKKKAGVRPLTSHLIYNPRKTKKTCRTILEK